MDWLFNPAIRAVPQKNLVNRDSIVSNFRKLYPNAEITYWKRNGESYLCDILYKKENGKKSYVFANPYNGKIQGESNLTIQRYFRDLHHFLFIPLQIGHFLVLTFGFLLLIALATALLFYKKWWRKLFEFQTGKSVLVFFRSLHRLIGLWSIPFALLFSITGIWYFMKRTHIVDIGRASPVQPKIEMILPRENINKTAKGTNISYAIDYSRAVAIAKERIPGLTVGNIIPPKNNTRSILLMGYSYVPLVRQSANKVHINPNTYDVTGVQKAEDTDAVMWLNDIANPLHFGYWGGLTTKIIWFVFGIGISSLILTGLWISLKKNAIGRKKANKKIMGAWRYINWSIYVLIMFFMYYNLSERYDASLKAIISISLGWMMFLSLAYYIFVYKLNQAVKTTSQSG